MDTRCATFETLLAMVQERLAAPDVQRWSSHVAQCPRCAAEWQAIESTHLELDALSAAELRAARPRTTWAPVVRAAERPPFLLRLPPALTDAVRTARAFGQPAVAGALGAIVLGLSLGTWLGLSTRASATAESAETYAASSLLASPSTGLASAYFEAEAAASATDLHAGDSAAAPAAQGDAR